jgi:cytoskeletal protein RodZ
MSDSTSGTGFGARLRQAREARGISLRQIATSTKISITALEALERNKISMLPGGIFSRAFVRSYAREVGLDPDETVREFLATFDEEGLTDGTPSSLWPSKRVDESAFESRQRVAGVVLRLVLVSLPIGILLLYFSTCGGPAVPAGPPEARLTISRQAPPPGLRESSAPVPGASAADRDAVPRSPEAPATGGGGTILLEVAPTGTCWVSLTVDGTLVLERVMEAGERVSRRVAIEALVHVGDAGTFAFSVNGRSGRALGGAGQVRTMRLTPETFEAQLR